MNQELDRLDPKEIVQVASFIAQKAGFKVETDWIPSFNKTKMAMVSMLRLSVLATISVAIASLLDPLESVTRYPDLQ